MYSDRKQFSCFGECGEARLKTQRDPRKPWGMMNMFIILIVFHEYVYMLKHQFEYFKCVQFLIVNYTSIKLLKRIK